jgi:hypothetical protein
MVIGPKASDHEVPARIAPANLELLTAQVDDQASTPCGGLDLEMPGDPTHSHRYVVPQSVRFKCDVPCSVTPRVIECAEDTLLASKPNSSPGLMVDLAMNLPDCK